MVAALKKPLPAEAVSQHPTKKYLSSIKPIYIVERLNEVFGLGGWDVGNTFVERTQGEKSMVIVKSNLMIIEYGIRIEAFGGNDNEDLGDAYKGACSDALSKIGAYLYIGMDVFKGLNKSAPVQAAAPSPKQPAAPINGKPPVTPTGLEGHLSGDLLTATVTAISHKKTVNGGDSWGFKCGDKWFNAFNAAVGQAVIKGGTYTFQMETKGKYTNIVGIVNPNELAEPAREGYDNNDCPF